jgi:hypothetical protein
MALVVVAVLLALAAAIGICGIRNPGRDVAASSCPAGQLAGAPSAVAAAPGVPMPEATGA